MDEGHWPLSLTSFCGEALHLDCSLTGRLRGVVGVACQLVLKASEVSPGDYPRPGLGPAHKGRRVRKRNTFYSCA